MKSGDYLKTQDQHARAWGEYLARFQWDYFGTHTFSSRYSENGARRAFERFLKSAEIRPVACCFFGIERGERYGRVHLHSLFQYQPEHRKPAKTIWRKWFETYGRASVGVPDSQDDVSAYCAKYTSKDMVDYDIIGKPLQLYDPKTSNYSRDRERRGQGRAPWE